MKVELASVWEKGPDGGIDLAKTVVETIANEKNHFHSIFTREHDDLTEKVETIVREIYGGNEVIYSKKAQQQLASFKKYGWDRLPICMAKTQYSLSDDPSKLGAPIDFDVTIREFVPKIGAGFVVALTGDVMTMPGLPKKPAALNMDVDEKGNAIGLF